MDANESQQVYFYTFLNKNNLLFRANQKIISDSTLVAITLLLAESKPEEKEIMVNIIMNFWNGKLIYLK